MLHVITATGVVAAIAVDVVVVVVVACVVSATPHHSSCGRHVSGRIHIAVCRRLVSDR
jgi:hypothetical protein